jgi:hypothetical protein
MPYFKDPFNKVHYLEGTRLDLLPSGSVQITAIRAAELTTFPKTPLDEIVSLEVAKPFTHRALRELSKTVAQMAQAMTGQDPLTNPEVAKLFKLDDDISKLRDQAKVQGLI